MPELPVITYPNEHLHLVAKPVQVFDDRLKELVRDMADTMYAKQGVGLAATQVDVHERVVVIDVTDEGNELRVLINPEILWASEETKIWEEGCLSIPGIYDKVERPDRVKVRAFDVEGNAFEFDADGLLAVCVQHEIDHLNGVLFIEHLSKLKQDRIRAKVKKALREASKG